MPVALYMDQHIPRAITFGLRARGVDVLTTQEDGTERFRGVLYAHLQQISIGRCVRDLEIIAHASEPEDCENFVLFLPL